MFTDNKAGAAILEVARQRVRFPIDIALDLSVNVFTTLRYAAKLSPVPFLSNAAAIALSIVNIVQKMRNNKHEFKELAKDSCEIVHHVLKACGDVSQPEDIPVDLAGNLEQLVDVLFSIQAFVQKKASRNLFVAMLRSGDDARRLQDYQKKLYHSIYIFGVQSDIILRKTVAQLAANQAEMTNHLKDIAAHVRADQSCAPYSPPNQEITSQMPPRDDISDISTEMLIHFHDIPSMDMRQDRRDSDTFRELLNCVWHLEMQSWLDPGCASTRGKFLLGILRPDIYPSSNRGVTHTVNLPHDTSWRRQRCGLRNYGRHRDLFGHEFGTNDMANYDRWLL